MLFSTVRKRKSEAQKFLAQMANQWTMDRVRTLEERRGEQRTTFNIGVWVIPVDESAPHTSKAFIALTRDLSSSSLSVIANRSIDTSEALVCFSGEPDPRFLRTKILYRKEMGLGWFQLCMEATGMVKKDDYPQLAEFAGFVMF
jgi:hypothetical protein